MQPSETDYATILRILEKHGVDYVVIGGVAGILHGSNLVTTDLDVMPARTDENLSRLSQALVEMHARLRQSGPPVFMRHFADGEWLLGASTWLFETDGGDFDLLFAPAGAQPFEGLAADALDVEAQEGLVVPIASLDDLIAMKEAANRTKDQLALPILRWLKARGGDVADEYPDPPSV